MNSPTPSGEPRVLFLIAARGGSKGVPGKNLRRLAGIPLVGFKALSAMRSRFCSRLVISTDSVDIQDEARRYGAEVPFTRPAELASDTASSVDVVLHAMDWVESNVSECFDAVMLLEPSSPFTRPLDYDNSIELMVRRRANVVVGVRPVEVNSVFVGALDADGRLTSIIDQMREWRRARRQDLPQQYTMNAALYLMRWDFLRSSREIYSDRENTYGYIMPPEYSVEIDSLEDLHRAEFLIEKGYVDLKHWSQA